MSQLRGGGRAGVSRRRRQGPHPSQSPPPGPRERPCRPGRLRTRGSSGGARRGGLDAAATHILRNLLSGKMTPREDVMASFRLPMSRSCRSAPRARRRRSAPGALGRWAPRPAFGGGGGGGGPPGPGGGPGPERVRGPLRAAGDLRGRVERPAAEVDGRRTLCARPSPGPLPPQGRGAPPKGPGGGGAVGGALASPWRRREGAAAHRAGRPGGRAPCAARGAPPPCPTPPAGPCPTRAPPPPAPPAPASRPVKLTGRPPGAPSVCPGWTQVPAVCPLRRGGTGAGSGFPGLSGP